MQPVMSHWRFRNRAPEVLIAFLRLRCWGALKVVRSYLGLGLTKFPLQVESRDGFRIELTSLAEVKVLWHVFVRKCYSPPSECQNIIDAGGNVGIFAIYAASQCPNARIFSLEPFPSTFRALCSNIERNELQHRVRPIQLGLSSTHGTCAMSGVPSSTDRRIVEVGSAAKNSLEWVPVVTLQEFMAQQDLDTIDFLKMDIEGSEWSVILSSPPELWQRIRHVQLEYHEVNATAGYHPQMLLDHLGRGGHSVVEHTEDVFHTGMIRSTFGRGGHLSVNPRHSRVPAPKATTIGPSPTDLTHRLVKWALPTHERRHNKEAEMRFRERTQLFETLPGSFDGERQVGPNLLPNFVGPIAPCYDGLGAFS